jgi:DNA-binding GntR family transcriptional regulator
MTGVLNLGKRSDGLGSPTMTDDLPLAPYQQIAADLAAQIRAGKLRKGDPLPTIPTLVDQYNVSRNTVIRAFRVLKDDGLVGTVQGLGTFVR